MPGMAAQVKEDAARNDLHSLVGQPRKTACLFFHELTPILSF